MEGKGKGMQGKEEEKGSYIWFKKEKKGLEGKKRGRETCWRKGREGS